jgi:hypothetical protein
MERFQYHSWVSLLLSFHNLGDGQIHKKTLENEKQGGSFDPRVVKELTDMGFTP